MDGDATELVYRYYDALDEHAYGVLEELLAPTFVQRRPDRTFEDRAAFLQFMREERPLSATTHEMDDVFAGRADREDASSPVVAARGRLLDGEDSPVIEFADHFEIDHETGRIVRLETYVR